MDKAPLIHWRDVPRERHYEGDITGYRMARDLLKLARVDQEAGALAIEKALKMAHIATFETDHRKEDDFSGTDHAARGLWEEMVTFIMFASKTADLDERFRRVAGKAAEKAQRMEPLYTSGEPNRQAKRAGTMVLKKVMSRGGARHG